MQETNRYEEVAPISNAPLWAMLERLDNRAEEIHVQTDRLRKQIDPLMSRSDKPVSNGRLDAVMTSAGTSQLVERLSALEGRLEEIGSRVCRWCNELEM